MATFKIHSLSIMDLELETDKPVKITIIVETPENITQQVIDVEPDEDED